MLIISQTISNNDITLSPTKALPSATVLSRSEFVGGRRSLGGHPVLAAARCLCLYLKS